MTKHKILMLGGTGFVGRQLAEILVADGHQVTILTRRRERHRDMLVLPTAQLVEGDIFNDAQLAQSTYGQDVVINLVGILNQPSPDGRRFDEVHAELPTRLVEACRRNGVARLLHMSALNADPDGPSAYLRSKGRGEAQVLAAESRELHVTVFRPSVIFGARDSFTNRFAALLRRVPFVFPLACANARFQPIYVKDVAQAFINALDRTACFGRAYNLCGPRVYTLLEIVRYLADLIDERPYVWPLKDWQSRWQARVLQFMPGKPFTYDNYLSMQRDSVCVDAPASVLGVMPKALEHVVPSYLRPAARRTTNSRA